MMGIVKILLKMYTTVYVFLFMFISLYLLCKVGAPPEIQKFESYSKQVGDWLIMFLSFVPMAVSCIWGLMDDYKAYQDSKI